LRKNHQEQLSLMEPWLGHEHAKELEAISGLLDANPMISVLATQDLVPAGTSKERGREGIRVRARISPLRRGRRGAWLARCVSEGIASLFRAGGTPPAGMHRRSNAGVILARALSGDLVVRAAVVRQMNGFSYRALAFHLQDSSTYRRFCRLGLADDAPKYAALACNIKALKPATWEAIHRIVLKEALARGVENGRKVRIDCTPVASPIHDPGDAWLLYDVVRVVARYLAKAKQLCGVVFSNRTRRAKRRMFGIHNAKKSSQRKRAYLDLLDVTVETLGFVPAALAKLNARTGEDWLEGMGLAAKLRHFEPLGWQVVDQTHRRVFEGEKVPASDKIVSIFEEHTDIIIKDRRAVHYGHKVCLSTGASALVLDCQILSGNPADSTLVEEVLNRHADIFGKVPRQAALDGGFASRANVKLAKENGVEDVCLSKRRGIEITDMVKSTWVYERLKRFRAGVEAGISFLKRCFGMDRCR